MRLTTSQTRFHAALLSADLKPRALALGLTLTALIPDPERSPVYCYDELAVYVGSRNRTVSVPRGHNLLSHAASELEEAGLIKRKRQLNQQGRPFGNNTPYRWQLFVPTSVSPPAWGQAALSTLAFAVGWGGTLGPSVTAFRARLDAAADTTGRFFGTTAELAAATRVSDKTALSHLEDQVRFNAGVRVEVVRKRPRTQTISLFVPRIPARPSRTPGPLRLPSGAALDCDEVITPAQGGSAPYRRSFAEAELDDPLAALLGRDAVEEAIVNCERRRGSPYTATEKILDFVEPLYQLWDGIVGERSPDFIVDVVLPALVAKSRVELVRSPRAYMERICRNELPIDDANDVFAPSSLQTSVVAIPPDSPSMPELDADDWADRDDFSGPEYDIPDDVSLFEVGKPG
jgi:hypothetical protein